MEGIIYIIRNNYNEKVYIGKTFSPMIKRFKEHIRESRKERSSHRKLYRAINKYGEDSFYIELLDRADKSVLSDLEIKYIEQYNSFKEGYNTTLGGDRSRYSTVPDKDIIDKYLELKCIRHVANFFNICVDTVKTILINNNIALINPISRLIKIIELDKEFPTVKDCCIFLIEGGYTKSNDLDAVRVSIKRAMRSNKRYLKLTFVFITEGVVYDT